MCYILEKKGLNMGMSIVTPIFGIYTNCSQDRIRTCIDDHLNYCGLEPPSFFRCVYQFRHLTIQFISQRTYAKISIQFQYTKCFMKKIYNLRLVCMTFLWVRDIYI